MKRRFERDYLKFKETFSGVIKMNDSYFYVKKSRTKQFILEHQEDIRMWTRLLKRVYHESW